MSTAFPSLLDSQGNIDSDKLSKELSSALEFDVRYKQTDNMKKRAVRTAANYDEFKAMVSCAHLKTLSRKEVESLSHVKKGWAKGPSASSGATSAILDLDREQERLRSAEKGEQTKTLVNPKKKPKSCMELERDLRRQSNDQEKYQYLQNLGLKSTISLLKKGADVDLIEEILRVLLQQCPRDEPAKEKPDEAVDCDTTTDADKHEKQVSLKQWMSKLSSMEKFDLMLDFANQSLIDEVKALIAHEDYLSTLPVELRNKLSVNKS